MATKNALSLSHFCTTNSFVYGVISSKIRLESYRSITRQIILLAFDNLTFHLLATTNGCSSRNCKKSSFRCHLQKSIILYCATMQIAKSCFWLHCVNKILQKHSIQFLIIKEHCGKLISIQLGNIVMWNSILSVNLAVCI